MPQNVEYLKVRLLALNKSENPFSVSIDGNDVVAEWNIVDATWYELFGKAGMHKTYQLRMTLYPETHEIRYVEREFSISWEAGVPKIGASLSFFQGKEFSLKKGKEWGIKNDGILGEVYSFDFNNQRIKKPVLEVVKQCGWTVNSSFLRTLFGFK